jgi:hypothetical protein
MRRREKQPPIGAIAIALWLLLALVAAAAAAPLAAQPAAEPASAAAFARGHGLRDAGGFAEALRSLGLSHALPPRYVTKDAAEAHGWHGGGLCEAWPGHLIGGDLYRDVAGNLPAAPGRIYREADLDSTCRSRGPKRLIFSNDGLLFLTLDHYRSFIAVGIPGEGR